MSSISRGGTPTRYDFTSQNQESGGIIEGSRINPPNLSIDPPDSWLGNMLTHNPERAEPREHGAPTAPTAPTAPLQQRAVNCGFEPFDALSTVSLFHFFTVSHQDPVTRDGDKAASTDVEVGKLCAPMCEHGAFSAQSSYPPHLDNRTVGHCFQA